MCRPRYKVGENNVDPDMPNSDEKGPHVASADVANASSNAPDSDEEGPTTVNETGENVSKGSSTPSNAPSVGVVGVENVENVVDGANSPVTATSAEGCRWAGATNDTHASSGSDTRRLQENVQNVQN